MAKKKIYDGKIYFDYMGNMVSDSPHLNYLRKNLSVNEINGDRIITSHWDSRTRTSVKCDSIYTLTELNVDVPIASHWKADQAACSVDTYFITDNYIFDDELQYYGYSRGQSSVGLTFKSTTSGKMYNVFLTDFEDIVKVMVNGVIKGKFTFTKRGTKFGVKLI